MDVINHVAAGPFAAACVLLGAAGAAKLRRPVTTQAAASALGLPDTRAAVRALGICELGAAGAGVAFGGAGAAAVAIAYFGLAAAAWRLYTRAPETPCGCLGGSTTPATASHVVVNIGAASIATLAVGSGPPVAAAGHHAWMVATFIVLAGSCAALVHVMLDALAALRAATRAGSST